MLTTFKNRSVLLTGHTGFKGSWLATWLLELGARVTGIALDPPSGPCHFDATGLGTRMTDRRIDIRDRAALESAVVDARPDFVFHLAAQPLVRQSYVDPVETYTTNVIGTLHVLETLRKLSAPCIAVLVTSDKAYDNVEWVWGYRETDKLGGPDPYSGSKGAAELVIRSHVRSFFASPDSPIRIGVGRAGNVIGGGDWAADRVVPDCIRAWSRGLPAELRNTTATRPWQHVLEPLSGYLVLADQLFRRKELHGEAFNFGPPAHQDHTVLELVEQMARHWEGVSWNATPPAPGAPHESRLLKLNCDKALHTLQWRPVMGFADTVQMTSEWYRSYYADPAAVADFTRGQIRNFTERARAAELPWAT